MYTTILYLFLIAISAQSPPAAAMDIPQAYMTPHTPYTPATGKKSLY